MHLTTKYNMKAPQHVPKNVHKFSNNMKRDSTTNLAHISHSLENFLYVANNNSILLLLLIDISFKCSFLEEPWR